jgi:hypothetical protein
MNREYGSCAAVRSYLNAFVDGELRGETLRGVSQHVETCASCSETIGEIGQLGNLLRGGLAFQAEPPDLAGLADGVVSRIRAEEHESWRGIFERATEDLHWVMVGVGSVVAAFISALVVSFVVQSGMGGQRGDSLAAMLNTLATTPPEMDRPSGLSNGLAALSIDDVQLASRAEVNDHVRSLKLLSNLDERDVRILVTELRRVKFAQQQDRRLTDPASAQVVLLSNSTEVRGKAKAL